MPKAKFREGSAAEAVPGEALESEDFWDFARTGEWFQHAVPALPEAGGGGFKGYWLCRRPIWELVLVDFVLYVSSASIVTIVDI